MHVCGVEAVCLISRIILHVPLLYLFCCSGIISICHSETVCDVLLSLYRPTRLLKFCRCYSFLLHASTQHVQDGVSCIFTAVFVSSPNLPYFLSRFWTRGSFPSRASGRTAAWRSGPHSKWPAGSWASTWNTSSQNSRPGASTGSSCYSWRALSSRSVQVSQGRQ